MYHIKILKRKNSRKYTPINNLETIDKVKKYMEKNKLTYAGTPYFFTHINLSDGSIISEEYNGVICSPVKLRTEFLK